MFTCHAIYIRQQILGFYLSGHVRSPPIIRLMSVRCVHLLYHVHYPPIIRGLPVRSHTFSTHTPRLNVSSCTFFTKCYVLSCLTKYILHQMLGVRLSHQVHLLIYSDLDSAMHMTSILTVLYFHRPNGNVLNLTNLWTF